MSSTCSSFYFFSGFVTIFLVTRHRNHLSHESQDSLQHTVRSSLSFDIRNFKHRNSQRRSESLDQSEHRTSLASLTPQHSPAHHHSPRHHNNNQPLRRHRRNLSMEPQQLSRDLAAALESARPIDPVPDYAEIYTPSLEKQPAWATATHPATEIDAMAETRNSTLRAPTPPLHRFPSWEAKIYQVASDGLKTGENGGSSQEPQESGNSMENSSSDGVDSSRAQRTASGGYCDINVPVYATVKGVSVQFYRHAPNVSNRSTISFPYYYFFTYSVHRRFERSHSAIRVMILATVKIKLRLPHAPLRL